MTNPTPGAGGQRSEHPSLEELLDSERADQRESARQRRIREGGPEWTPDDLTMGELHQLLRERGER